MGHPDTIQEDYFVTEQELKRQLIKDRIRIEKNMKEKRKQDLCILLICSIGIPRLGSKLIKRFKFQLNGFNLN